MRVIFLGTPEFAVPTLKRLTSWTPCQVVAVVTQPDRPRGRGQKLNIPPTKLFANSQDIPVFQPEKLSKSSDCQEAMQKLKPDVLIMVAFGQILKEPVLQMAPWGVINLHGSLLPKYRGAAPINWAIINGERKTGVTTMFSDKGVDTGPMLLKREVEIDPNINAQELGVTLSEIGADLVLETLGLVAKGSIQPISQNDAEATYAPLIKKELGTINWHAPAEAIHNLVRGLVPWPGTYTTYAQSQLKVIRTSLVNQYSKVNCQPGSVLSITEGICVACGSRGQEILKLDIVQPASRNQMSAQAWAHGARLKTGDFLGQ